MRRQDYRDIDVGFIEKKTLIGRYFQQSAEKAKSAYEADSFCDRIARLVYSIFRKKEEVYAEE